MFKQGGILINTAKKHDDFVEFKVHAERLEYLGSQLCVPRRSRSAEFSARRNSASPDDGELGRTPPMHAIQGLGSVIVSAGFLFPGGAPSARPAQGI